MLMIATREEKELLERLRKISGASAIAEDAARESIPGLTAEIVALKKQIATLEIDKSRKEEDFARQDRELRHMIGLEKKRQEVEIAQAKRDTELSIREGNLAAERKRFEEQLTF